MTYDYKCPNASCDNFNEIIVINKSVNDSSKIEYCPKCNIELRRIFSSPSIKTADKYKS